MELRRLNTVFQRGCIKAVVEYPDRDEVVTLDVESTIVGMDERMNDVAILRASRHPEIPFNVFNPMLMDFDSIDRCAGRNFCLAARLASAREIASSDD